MPLKLKERNISNKHNSLKNPKWREADQLAIYKHDRGVELGSTEKQLQLIVVRAGLEPETLKSGALTTRPRCLRTSTDMNEVLSAWTNLFFTAVDERIPKKRKKKIRRDPWISLDIIKLVQKKKRLYTECKYGGPLGWRPGRVACKRG